MTWNMKVTKTPQRCAVPQSSCSTPKTVFLFNLSLVCDVEQNYMNFFFFVCSEHVLSKTIVI